MAEDRKGLKIKEDGLGEVQIAEEVITIIAGLAATEVEGVCSMGGNITKELVSRLGMKNLSKGVRVEVTEEGKIEVFVTINIAYGYAIRDSICSAIGCRGMNASTPVFFRLMRMNRRPSAVVPIWHGWSCLMSA